MPKKSKEYAAFEKLTDRLLTVSHETVQKRIAADKAEAAQNPKKRGPKPKASASHDPA